ncbi:MAG: hypothetical protein R2847_01340 [Bacteroidia bacterium]
MIKHLIPADSCSRAGTASAQKIKIQEGSLKSLKDQTKMNVVYDYSDMRVGKFAKEEIILLKKLQNITPKTAAVMTGLKMAR